MMTVTVRLRQSAAEPRDARPDAERAREILDAHESRARERMLACRAICETCPGWNGDGQYCEVAYRTCRCAMPAAKARDKTRLWQRTAVCPQDKFAEVKT